MRDKDSHKIIVTKYFRGKFIKNKPTLSYWRNLPHLIDLLAE